MGIKYICDFCGGQADNHKTFEDKRIICKDCLGHLEKQTWKLAEEPRELQKEKERLEKAKKDFSEYVKEKEKEYETDRLIAKRYQCVVYSLLNLYNKIIQELNEIIPRGFLIKRPLFKLIDIEKFKEEEGCVIEDAVRKVEGNYYNNFNYYGCSHINTDEWFEGFPMSPLPWDK